MPKPTDLTLLQDVKAWALGPISGQNTWPAAAAGADYQLDTYISNASRAILSACQRPTLLNHTIVETRDGTGGPGLMLKDYPVLSIASLYSSNQLIPPRPGPSGTIIAPEITFTGGVPGYVPPSWDGMPPGSPFLLALANGVYQRGIGNVQVTYQAGYVVQSEAQTIPSNPGPYTVAPSAPYGRYSQNVGVTYANGTPLTAIASGTPSQGQYVAPPLPPSKVPTAAQFYAPVYTFAAADAGAAILISYSFVPYDLVQACTQWVGEWYSYRQRIGQKSMAMPAGQGTASFAIGDIPKDIMAMIQPYKRLVTV